MACKRVWGRAGFARCPHGGQFGKPTFHRITKGPPVRRFFFARPAVKNSSVLIYGGSAPQALQGNGGRVVLPSGSGGIDAALTTWPATRALSRDSWYMSHGDSSPHSKCTCRCRLRGSANNLYMANSPIALNCSLFDV